MFRIEAARMGLRRFWQGRGEMSGGRFAVPDDNLDVSLVHARFVEVDFSGLRFASFLAHDSVFEGCDFTRTVFDHVLFGATTYGGRAWDRVSWPVTVYRNCVFTRTRVPMHAFFGNARFEGCVFDGARLRDQTSTEQAQFVDCTFRGKLQDVRFQGEPTSETAAIGRSRNDFTGNDFTGAELIDVEFRNVDLRAQRFPGPPGYALLDRIDQRVAAVLAAIEDWPDETVRQRASTSLRMRAESAVGHTGGYALVSRDWPSRRLPPDIRERIFRMLVSYNEIQQ